MPPRGLVLVVDDEPALRAMVVEVLRQRGFEVQEAANGREALATLAACARPVLVLTDRRMPGLDGVALFDAIRAIKGYEQVPIAFFSGSNDDGGRPVTVIEKPLHLDAFVEAIEAIVRVP